jgi:hypothetical protein
VIGESPLPPSREVIHRVAPLAGRCGRSKCLPTMGSDQLDHGSPQPGVDEGVEECGVCMVVCSVAATTG